MPQTNETIPATTVPQMTTIIMALIRGALLLLSGAGVITANYTDAQLIPLAGAIGIIAGFAWQVYEQFRQQRLRHAAAVASARGGLAVQHLDYKPGGKK